MANQETVKNNFWQSLANLLRDLTSLDVDTYVTYEGLEGGVEIELGADASLKQKVKCALQASTHLDLDSDSRIVLPVTKSGVSLEVNEEILRIHEEHVKLAMDTRSAMIKALLDAIPSIVRL